MSRRLIAALALVAGAACEPTIVSFAVAPDTLPADGGYVSVTWKVTGTDRPVLLLPDDLYELYEAEGEQTLLLHATVELVLRAGAAEQSRFVQVGETPIPQVRGVVIDREGRPVAGRLVSIGDRRTTSDAAGTIEFTNVIPPYSLQLAQTSDSPVTWYVGLRSPQPTIIDFNAPAPQSESPRDSRRLQRKGSWSQWAQGRGTRRS